MFYKTLTSFISHLRRQQNLVSAMKTTCPKVASTTWLSLGTVSNWFSKYRDALISHFEIRAPAAAPPPTWWIYLLALQSFTGPVDIFFKSMQGPRKVVCDQHMILRRLVESLRYLLEVEGPQGSEENSSRSTDPLRITVGSYASTMPSIQHFMADLGDFSLSH